MVLLQIFSRLYSEIIVEISQYLVKLRRTKMVCQFFWGPPCTLSADIINISDAPTGRSWHQASAITTAWSLRLTSRHQPSLSTSLARPRYDTVGVAAIYRRPRKCSLSKSKHRPALMWTTVLLRTVPRIRRRSRIRPRCQIQTTGKAEPTNLRRRRTTSPRRRAVCEADRPNCSDLISWRTTAVLRPVASRDRPPTTRSGTRPKLRILLRDVRASLRSRPVCSSRRDLRRTWRGRAPMMSPAPARPTSRCPSYCCRLATSAPAARTPTRTISCKSAARHRSVETPHRPHRCAVCIASRHHGAVVRTVSWFFCGAH